MGEFVKVASTGDVAPGEAIEVEYEGEQVCLANVKGTFYAIGGECTHVGGPLGEGEVDEDQCTLQCPWHGGLFDLRSGEVLGPPPAQAVPRYEVKVEGDEVKIAKP